MKTLTTSLQAILADPAARLAWCWRIHRRDGTVMGFTDADESLTVASGTYAGTYWPAAAMSMSDVESRLGAEGGSLEARGILTDDAITSSDLLAGRYDGAEVRVFVCPVTASSAGQVTVLTGKLGDVTLDDGKFGAQILSLSDQLSQGCHDVYSPTCRAQLGDSRCAIATTSTSWTSTATVTAVTDLCRITLSATWADGWLNYGMITFDSGANAGVSMEIMRQASAEVWLLEPPPFTISTATSVTVRAGCDKTRESCRDKFSNIANFRGEPDIPGADMLIRTPNAHS